MNRRLVPWKWMAVITGALFAISPVISLQVHPNEYEGGRSRDALAGAYRNSSAIAVMLGELRTSMTDLMFIKTERYLHSGIAYTPHLEKELMSVTSSTEEFSQHQEEVVQGETGHEHHHDGLEHEHHHGEEHSTTIIPSAGKDFRGILGDLEREVKPWQDPNLPHQHTDGTELLPWYRVMTLSDPHNVRAYALGSWWLKRHNMEEAIKFAEEGLKNNPDSFQMPLMLGKLLYEKAWERAQAGKSPDDPETHDLYVQATDYFNHAATLAEGKRPEGGPKENDTSWSMYDDEDAMAALRMAALTTQQYGDHRKAVHWAKTFIQFFGEDTTAGLKELAESK